MTARTVAGPTVLSASSAASAPAHAVAARTEIHGVDPRWRAVRASAAFTTAKMMRRPELPMVEMLFKSSAFASTIVDPEVISGPSIGWFQIGRWSWAGSSLDLEMT